MSSIEECLWHKQTQATQKKTKACRMNWPLQLSWSLCIWGNLSLSPARVRPLTSKQLLLNFSTHKEKSAEPNPSLCRTNANPMRHSTFPAFPCSRSTTGQVHTEAEEPVSPAHLDVYTEVWFCAVWELCLDNCNWGQFLRKDLSSASLHTGFPGLRVTEGKKSVILQSLLLEVLKSFIRFPATASKSRQQRRHPISTWKLFAWPLFKGQNEEWPYFPTLVLHTAGIRPFTSDSPVSALSPSFGISLWNGCCNAHLHKCSVTWLFSQQLCEMDRPGAPFSSPDILEGAAMCLLMEGRPESERGKHAAEQDYPSRCHLLPPADLPMPT